MIHKRWAVPYRAVACCDVLYCAMQCCTYKQASYVDNYWFPALVFCRSYRLIVYEEDHTMLEWPSTAVQYSAVQIRTEQNTRENSRGEQNGKAELRTVRCKLLLGLVSLFIFDFNSTALGTVNPGTLKHYCTYCVHSFLHCMLNASRCVSAWLKHAPLCTEHSLSLPTRLESHKLTFFFPFLFFWWEKTCMRIRNFFSLFFLKCRTSDYFVTPLLSPHIIYFLQYSVTWNVSFFCLTWSSIMINTATDDFAWNLGSFQFKFYLTEERGWDSHHVTWHVIEGLILDEDRLLASPLHFIK